MMNYSRTLSVRHTLMSLLISLMFAACASDSAARGLSIKKCEEVRQQVIDEWKGRVREQYKPMFTTADPSAFCVRSTEATMPFWFTVYGAQPPGRRSMWISLHGGGGVPQEVNDGQWENQKMLYKPREGVYVAPRAPWNAWNMWCQAPIDSLYEKLIQCMVTCYGVDPDKVYLMGYSAGGDGVWRMATRMPDHFAAASMMAGHPGDVGLRNLRNLPYMIWCGENDEAYDRNVLCALKGRQLDSLQHDCPEGYIHETHIMKGKGHWMNREDSAAVPWMYKYVRNPYPKTIVWQQEEVTREFFYWLKVPREEMARGKCVELCVKGNIIDIQRCDYSQLTLYLNDELVDMNRKVEVKMYGSSLFKGKVSRTEKCLRESMAERGDPSYCFPGRIVISELGEAMSAK